MYKDGEEMRLYELKDLNIGIDNILDIGAHTGQFHGWARVYWPESFIYMIEANSVHESSLDRLSMISGNTKYEIAALGDEEREVTFYTRSDKPHTEGNSYYKEANYWDIPQLVQENTMTLQKLDDIFKDRYVFDLIKIDTQGSELDILKGGKDLVSKSKAVILEVAYIEYNLGAPSSDEVIEYMRDIGFENKMSIGEHYEGKDVSQKDLLFLSKEL
tara:strand:+ start:1116 stop:1763 length:648 start_codon:yes stop_codon:yes gene_type:complete